MIHFLCGFKLNITGSNAKNSAITDHLIISGAETYKQPDTVTYGEIPSSSQGFQVICRGREAPATSGKASNTGRFPAPAPLTPSSSREIRVRTPNLFYDGKKKKKTKEKTSTETYVILDFSEIRNRPFKSVLFYFRKYQFAGRIPLPSIDL